MARATQKFPSPGKWAGLLHDRNAALWASDALYGMQASDKYIATAAVLTLNATAVEVVPAPGSGKYNVFIGAAVFLDYNSIAYAADAGEDLVFTYTDKNGAEISNTLDGEEWEGTADVLKYAYPLNAAASALVGAANAPICLFLKSGEWASGDSPLKVRTFYRVLDSVDLIAISA